jgi:hypothetical protein
VICQQVPRMESHDARNAQHNLKSGHLRQATKVRLAEFFVDMKMPKVTTRKAETLLTFLVALAAFSIPQEQV